MPGKGTPLKPGIIVISLNNLIKGYAVLVVYVAHFFDPVSVLFFHKWLGV